jgi:DNA-binding CsgD family transcriptional regulator
MDAVGRLSEAIERFYAAAAEDGRWDEAFEMAGSMVGASAVEVTVVDRMGANATFRLDRRRGEGDFVGELIAAFASDAAGTAHASGRSVQALPSPSRAGGADKGDQSIRVALGREAGPSLSFSRAARLPGFTDEDRLMVDALAPHIRRSLSLAASLAQLRRGRDELAFLLDHIAPQAMILAADRTILHLNAGGRQLLDEKRSLRSVGGKLDLATPGGNGELSRGIAGDSESFVIQAGANGSRILLTGIRLPERLNQSGRTALLLVTYATAHACQPVDVFREAFDLTAAEARVLGALVMGGSREMIASELGLSLSTVKTHMQNLFAKTGVNRQAQLVRIAMALPRTGSAAASVVARC